MTGNLPSVMSLMRSTNILQSNINLAFSCSNKMLYGFDDTPSRGVSCSLGIQTTMRLGQGQVGSTDLSVENCFQQMHFITQLHLFLELALHIYELVRRTCSSFFLSSLCYPCPLMAFLEVLALVFYQLPCPQKWLVHFWNLPLANSPPSSSWLPYLKAFL